MDTSPLVSQTIHKLERLMANSSTDRLPPLRVLAREFRVSYPVVAHAAGVLREKGVLDFSRGRGLQVIDRRTDRAPDTGVSTNGYVRTIKWVENLLGTGALRSGAELPKYSTIAGDLHVSCTTVSKAMQYLVRNGIVHRSGKKVLAGSPPEPDGYRRHFTGNTILVVHDRALTWNSLATSTRTSPFISSFVNEVNKYNVRLQAVFTGASRAPDGDFPVGLPAVRDFAQSLGRTYCGTLVLPTLEQLPEMAEWTRVLGRLRKPVVWFDRLDERTPQQHTSKMWYRSHFSEHAAARCAVEFMHDLGYRALYFVATTNHAWCRHRADLLCHFGEETGIEVTVVMDTTSKRVDQRSVSTVCATLLEQNSFLPIIADRDKTTISLMAHLRAKGLKIRKDYGILSFDNFPQVMPLGITSVDFGFDWLGYAAFHAILGVIPVGHQRNGDISPRPYIVDRGSMPPCPS